MVKPFWQAHFGLGFRLEQAFSPHSILLRGGTGAQLKLFQMLVISPCGVSEVWQRVRSAAC